MILYILITLAVVVAGFVLFVASRPSEFRVARSATFPAPASVLFPHVNDLHLWQEWSPWAKMDPNTKTTFAGPSSGVGANFRWESSKTGVGSMTIVESRPDERVQIKLEFLKPFQATNTALFTFAPTGDSTVVTWSMTGENKFIGKAFGLFVDCEKMCGTQFEQGLSNLEGVVQSELTTKS